MPRYLNFFKSKRSRVEEEGAAIAVEREWNGKRWGEIMCGVGETERTTFEKIERNDWSECRRSVLKSHVLVRVW